MILKFMGSTVDFIFNSTALFPKPYLGAQHGEFVAKQFLFCLYENPEISMLNHGSQTFGQFLRFIYQSTADVEKFLSKIIILTYISTYMRSQYGGGVHSQSKKKTNQGRETAH